MITIDTFASTSTPPPCHCSGPGVSPHPVKYFVVATRDRGLRTVSVCATGLAETVDKLREWERGR